MGSKYTTLATSGYNSSPPADDGSQVAANLISWATHKTKLTDPVKTLADAINSALVTAFDYSVRQITASDNTVASDHMKCVEIAPTVTTAVTVSLGDAATMTNNYRVFVKNSSARNQTVSRVTGGDTIDGVAGSITLPPLSGAIFQTTTGASGYLIDSWFGPTSDGTAIVAGGTDGTKKVRLEVDGLTTATTRVVTVPDRDITIGDLSSITASLGADVALNNTGTYFDGPTIAQGTSGTWFVSGTVSLQDTAAAADFHVKLWDGTTVIASAIVSSSAINTKAVCALSGYLAAPAANLRISAKDASSTSGKILFNATSNSKDSTITAIRVA